MPSIDLSRYEAKKKAPSTKKPVDRGFLALLNKDITLGSNTLNDKKKEAFDEKVALLERLLQSEREKVELLKAGK